MVIPVKKIRVIRCSRKICVHLCYLWESGQFLIIRVQEIIRSHHHVSPYPCTA